MKHATIIFPHQLFEAHPALSKDRPCYLVEHEHFFHRFLFHKQKLIFHKATMEEYKKYLTKQGFQVQICTYDMSFEILLKKENIGYLHYSDLHDTILEKKIINLCAHLRLKKKVYESPYFLTRNDELKELLNKDHFFMASFYQKQRKRLSILMSGNKPIGGKYSFDVENRQRLPFGARIPALPAMPVIDSVIQARNYIEKHFSNNPGFVDHFIYPVNFTQARDWFNHFLHRRLARFGPYQDSLKTHEPFLFHSALSPLLNVGLLTPRYVIDNTLAYAVEHKIPLESLEGFIRQIIGWREFVYGVYILKGNEQRSGNYFNHTCSVPYRFTHGSTSLFPIDECIEHVLKFCYAHHIERLMVLGNFLLLLETDPNAVFGWFMEFFVDAYDWVMVPNVYGMSQYADAGLIVTKPSICSSNYLKKMSNYPEGPWVEKLDALYWHFLYKNQKKLSNIPRLMVSMAALSKMPKRKLRAHCKMAEVTLTELHEQAW